MQFARPADSGPPVAFSTFSIPVVFLKIRRIKSIVPPSARRMVTVTEVPMGPMRVPANCFGDMPLTWLPSTAACVFEHKTRQSRSTSRVAQSKHPRLPWGERKGSNEKVKHERERVPSCHAAARPCTHLTDKFISTLDFA